jgi:hypothetical protein
VKLCKDCKHRQSGVFSDDMCTRRGIEIDVVDGRHYGKANKYCNDERAPIRWYSRDRCGPEGRYYVHN